MTSVAFSKKMRHKTHFPLENDQDQMVVKSVSIPAGLEILMEGLTKEVLRVQPEDICLFASHHFARLIKIREAYESNLKVNKIVGKAKEVVKSANILKKAKAEEDGSKNTILHIKSETTNLNIRGNETSRSEASTAEFDKLHASNTIQHQNETQEAYIENDEGTSNSIENLNSSNTISNENGHIAGKTEINEDNEVNSQTDKSIENQIGGSDVQATQTPDELVTLNEANKKVSPEDTSNNKILESKTSNTEENKDLNIRQEKQDENEDISTNTKDTLNSEGNNKIEESDVPSELKTDEIVAPNEAKENVSSQGTSNNNILESEPSNTKENNLVDIQPKTEDGIDDISRNTRDKLDSKGNNEIEDSDVQALKTDKIVTPNETKGDISSEGTGNNKILESELSNTEENNVIGIQQQKHDENEGISTNTKDKLDSERNDDIEDSDVQALKTDEIIAPNEAKENVSSEGTSNSKILESEPRNTEENNVLDIQQEKQDENEDTSTNTKEKLDSEGSNKIEDPDVPALKTDNVLATNEAEKVHDLSEETDKDNVLERSDSTEKNKDLEQEEQNKNENLPANIKYENDDINTVSFEEATEKIENVSGNSEDNTPDTSTDTELRNSSDIVSNEEKQDNEKDLSDDNIKEESLKIEPQTNDEKLTQAATKIQSVWRGYSYRKQNKEKDVEGNLSGINANIVSHIPANIAQLSASQQKIKALNENNEIQENELVLEETSQSSNRTPPAEEKEETHISETVDKNNLITPVPISTTTINEPESNSDNDVMHEINSTNLKEDNILPEQKQQEESTEEQHSEEKTNLISEKESSEQQENTSDKEANIDQKNNNMKNILPEQIQQEESTEEQHSEEKTNLSSEKESSAQQENTSDKEANIDKKNNNMKNILPEQIQQEESTEEQHSEEKTNLISEKESSEQQENTSDKEANIDKKNNNMKNILPEQIQQEESTEEQHSEEKTNLSSEKESSEQQENTSDKEANIDKKSNNMKNILPEQIQQEESTEEQHSEEKTNLSSEKESSEQQENTSDKEENIDKKNNNMKNILPEQIQQEESTEEQHLEEKTNLSSEKESSEQQENTSDKEANIDKKNNDMDNTNKILNNVENTENVSQNNLENNHDSSDIANHSNRILSLQSEEILGLNSKTVNNEQNQENFVSENKLHVDMNQELKDKTLSEKPQNNLEANENSEKNNYRLNTKESEENKETEIDEKEIIKENAVIVSSGDIKNYEHTGQQEESNWNSDSESANMEEDKNKGTKNIQDSKTKGEKFPVELNKNESKEGNPNSSEVNSEHQKQAKERNLKESFIESTDSKTDETTEPENSPNIISVTQNSYMNEEKKTITDETTESTINMDKPDSQEEDKKAADTNISEQNSTETNSEYLSNDTPEKHIENISAVAVPEKCQETEKTSTTSTDPYIHSNNDNTEKQEVVIDNTDTVPEVNNEDQTNRNETNMVENHKNEFMHLKKENEKKEESQESVNQLSANKGGEIAGPLVENTENSNKILTNEDSNILTSSDDSKPSMNKESEKEISHDEENEHLIESKTTEASNTSETSLQEQSSSEKKNKDELNVKPNEESMLEEQNTSASSEPDIKNMKHMAYVNLANSTEKEENVETKPDGNLKETPALLTEVEDSKTNEDLENNDSSTEKVNVIPTNLKKDSKEIDLNSETKEDLFNTSDENQNIAEDNNAKIILETTTNTETPRKEDLEVSEKNWTTKDTAESKNSNYKLKKEEQHVDLNNQEDGKQNEIQNEENNDTVSVLIKKENENNEKDLNEEHNISETSNENKADFQKNVDGFESAVLENENLEKLEEHKGEEKDISNSESCIKVPGTNIDNSAITKTEHTNLENESKGLTNLSESNEGPENKENQAYQPTEKTEANIINDKTVSEINHNDQETHNNEKTNNTALKLKASKEENEIQGSESNDNEAYEPNKTEIIIQQNDDNGKKNYSEENNEVSENSDRNETAKSEAEENKKDIEKVMVNDQEKNLDEKESAIITESNKTGESSSDAPKKSEETVESETENKDNTNLDNSNDNENLQSSTEENEVKLDKNKLEYTNLQYALVTDSDNKTKEDAAVKIQHAWRYFNKRRSLQYMDKLQKPAECDELSEQRGEEDDAKILKAAVLLQAGVRGFLSRKKLAASRKSSEDGISESVTKSSATGVASQSSNVESTLAREDTLEMDDKDTLQNISTDVSSESTTSSLPNSENTVIHFDSKKATSTDLDESEIEPETDKKVTAKTEKEDIRVTNTNEKKEESVHSCTTNILFDDSKLKAENITGSLNMTDDLSNNSVVEKKHTTHESSEPTSTNQIKQHLEDKSIAISKQQGINFDDFDSSKYDLKQEHKSPRSRSSTPILELSSAAYKIGAAIATNNDKIINAIDGEPEAPEEKVEYIHIPLHDPTAKKSKTESVQELKSYSEVAASKKELSNLNNQNESSPEYIYIPLKPVTSSTYKENDKKDDTNITTVQIEHNTNNEQYISNTEIYEKPQLEANKVNVQGINTGKHEGNNINNSSSTEPNEGSITPLPHPTNDTDSFNRESKLSTTNKQDSTSASSNRKILDEIDVFIKTYEQKRQISPNNSNHKKLDQGLINNDLTNESQRDESISSEKNSAATKIQSLYRGYSTRKNLKTETDKKKLEEQSNKNRRNSSDTDKTYIIEKGSPGSQSTPDDISSDEETRNIAASKIQNSYRNYRRKRETVLNVGQPLQNIDDLEYKHPSSPDVTSHVIKQEELKDPLELAATKIQRSYRIYKNRQSLTKNNSESSVLQTIPELSSTSQTDSKMYSTSSVNEEKAIPGPVTSASAAQEENSSDIVHTANHLTTSLDNKSTTSSVTSEKLDKTGITHKQFSESYIQNKSAAASSVLSTDRNIQTETDTSDHDSVDYKIAKKMQHVADDKNENIQRMVEPGLLHSGEMHDSIDIFLSSEELSQGAEKLTSQPTPVPHDRRDVGSLSTAAEPAQTQEQLPCAPNSAPLESLHHHFVMEAAESKEAQSQSTNMGIASTEQEAATKIQAGFRGYQVRKQMKLKKNGSEDAKTVKRSSSGRRKVSQRRTENQNANAKTPSDLEERSATKIQAGIRGFLVRKRQKNIKNEES